MDAMNEAKTVYIRAMDRVKLAAGNITQQLFIFLWYSKAE